MKRLIVGPFCLGLVFVFVLTAQSNPGKTAGNPPLKDLPRIAICGLGIESSTFSPAQTEEPAFHAKYNDDVFATYPFMSIDSPLRHRVTWIPTLVGHALPGGIVTRQAYESLVKQTLDMLTKEFALRRFVFRYSWRNECCWPG